MNIIDKLFDDPIMDELNNMNRWNGANRIKEETVAHHSYIVTLFARLISEEVFKDDKSKLLATTYAIFHDFDEIFTGDLNHNLKYNKFNGDKIRSCVEEFIVHKANETFSDFEQNSNFLINKILNKDTPKYIKSLVKICDWLGMIYYLKKERMLGNTSLNDKYNHCVAEFYKSCDKVLLDLDYETTVISNVKIIQELKEKKF